MPVSTDLIEGFAKTPGPLRPECIVEANPELKDVAVVLSIADHVNRLAQEDLDAAERLADLLSWLADLVDDDSCRARALRCRGNIKVFRSDFKAALNEYESAFHIYCGLNAKKEQAATLASMLQPLIYVGKYNEAFDYASRARRIAETCSDELLLARIVVNFANILHRQDRFSEATEHYLTALQTLRRLRQTRDCAVALLNLAVCYISLRRLSDAQSAYEEARRISVQEGMAQVTAQADYNIAYLYYYRGDYAKAIDLYRKTKAYCEEVSDTYHSALCELDLAELHAELHLQEESAHLANQAYASFEQMGMPYETAKSIIWQGVAAFQNRQPFRALDFFIQAEQQMEREGNLPWVAALNLFQASIFRLEGRYFEALKLCKRAEAGFRSLPETANAVHAILLLAHIHLDLRQTNEAARWLQQALDQTNAFQTATLSAALYGAFGRLAEQKDNLEDARNYYRLSAEYREKTSIQANVGELKISSINKDSDALHSLLALQFTGAATNGLECFELIEKIRSREMLEMVGLRASTIPVNTKNRSPLVEQVKQLREQLSWYYREAGSLGFSTGNGAKRKGEDLQRLITSAESALLRSFESIRATHEEFYSVQTGSIAPVERIREALQPNEILIEFFDVRGMTCAILLTQKASHVVPVARTFTIRTHLRALQTQFMGVHFASEGKVQNSNASVGRTRLILSDLYNDLVRPIRALLENRRLIVAPGGPLSYVPFHALWDGRGFMTDEFVISYVSSATLLALNSTKPPIQSTTDVAVAAASNGLIPGKGFKVVPSLDSLATLDAPPRFLHLNCKMHISERNPILSSIAVGGTDYTVLDLFSLDLSSSVVGVIGGGPGIRSFGDGKEIQALTRALQYSGARNLLFPLWNAPGHYAQEFLGRFYEHASAKSDTALAVKLAMTDFRQTYADPFIWAPFTLRE